MRYFDRNRRCLTKCHKIRGVLKSVTGTSSVTIEQSAGVPIKSIEIVGKTLQSATPTLDVPVDIQNANDSGMKITLNGETIEIPASITIDEEEVPLLFSEYDSLSVDGINNKVKYTRGSYQKVFTGDEHFYTHSYPESNGYGRYFVASTNYAVTSGRCTHFRRVGWLDSSTVTNVYSMVYIATKQNRFAFKLDGDTTTTITDFKELLKSQYDNGTPVIVQAKRYTPIEYDITDTDLGKSLLSLCVPKGENGTLQVTSDIGITSLDVSYYSEVAEDTVELRIVSLNEKGEEIAEPRVHIARRGAQYLIVPPHIDGYTRVSTQILGVASGDEQINLIYKEAEDASV